MPIITAIAAAICGILHYTLTVQVIRARRSEGVSLGDGGSTLLERRIRGQANASEQMPLALIALLCAELLAGPGVILGLSAAVFCLGRVLHGVAFGWMVHSKLRIVGMALSLTGSAMILIYLVVSILL